MQLNYIIKKSRRRSISISVMTDNRVLVKAPYGTLERTVQEFLLSKKEFYAEIERVFPDYKRCNKWLKDNGGVYMKRVSCYNKEKEEKQLCQ